MAAALITAVRAHESSLSEARHYALVGFIQHVSDVAKEAQERLLLPYGTLDALILPEPKDRLEEAWGRALEVYHKTHHAVGEPRKAGLAALRETLALGEEG